MNIQDSLASLAHRGSSRGFLHKRYAMNFVFISPNFPTAYERFCEGLHDNGVNVLGIGDASYDSLSDRLKNALTEYYRVEDMRNYDQMIRAMGYFTGQYGKIDWVESNNEYWMELDAALRTDFNITTGLKSDQIMRYRSKTAMKKYWKPLQMRKQIF